MTAFYAPLRSFQQGLQDIISLDQQIVELSKVTGETSIALEEMGNTAIEMATNLGRSAQEIAEATTAFARLGYEIQEASRLAEEAVVLDVVGNFNDINKATTALTSTMKAYNLEAEEARQVTDAVNLVGNNFAASQEDISEILRRSSSAMQAANNEMEELIALGVGGQEVVQNARQVGTALNG